MLYPQEARSFLDFVVQETDHTMRPERSGVSDALVTAAAILLEKLPYLNDEYAIAIELDEDEDGTTCARCGMEEQYGEVCSGCGSGDLHNSMTTYHPGTDDNLEDVLDLIDSATGSQYVEVWKGRY